MLKITKASDAITVDHIIACIYAPPGAGKTSLAFTAESPLLLDFDSGVHRSKNRGDSVRVASWAEVAKLAPADLADYKTLVVDTAGRALDMLAVSIMEDDPKARNRNGGLTLPGFGALKSVFLGWLSAMKTQGKDIILICHSDETKKGDDVIERIDVQGGSKNEIYKSADLMGRLGYVGNSRVLNFSPTETTFGKNPAQLDALPVPDFSKDAHFLGTVIASVKATLNEKSAENQRLAALADEWRKRIDECKDPKACDAMLKSVMAEPVIAVQATAKALLWAHAQTLKFEYVKDKGFSIKVAA